MAAFREQLTAGNAKLDPAIPADTLAALGAGELEKGESCYVNFA